MVILAKKSLISGGLVREKTLFEHIRDVLEAAEALFGTETCPARMTRQWLSFFRILLASAGSFIRLLRTAILFHDIGKSNLGFQNTLTGTGVQIWYHEFISGWMLYRDSFRALLDSAGLDSDITIASVMGHHLRLDKGTFTSTSLNTATEILHEGVDCALELFTVDFGGSPLSSQDLKIPPLIDLSDDDTTQDIARLAKLLRTSFGEETKLRMLRAVRTALIVCDAAGSGLAREMGQSVDIPVSQWISDSFHDGKILSDRDLDRMVIEPRRRQIASNEKEVRSDISEFQRALRHASDRVLLLAPCGAGKTLAAWEWGAGVASRHQISRFIFLYPTRGTSTEGFRDYVSWAPESDGALLHGTSRYELEGMFENPEERSGGFGKDFTTNDRLFAIGFWQKRLFSATVDQFLGFMSNGYRSTCLMPMLADSAVVFDEVHSFDQNLFSALLGFLEDFEVPVLCMTASLHENRLEQLRAAGLDIHIPALGDQSTAQRYHVERTDRKKTMESALEEYRKGGKVLWVVNTVARCQEIAREISERLLHEGLDDSDVLCYHSRFRLQDRKRRHNELIARFKASLKGAEPLIAVTTQVCEMSLDISATLLISEDAPITSLIQRMGRCNRYLEVASGGRVAFYPPEDRRPYSLDDWRSVNDFINALLARQARGNISQQDLQDLLNDFSPDNPDMKKFLPFLTVGGFASSSGESLRDIDEYTVQAVLEDDADRYISLRRENRPTDGLIVPAPRNRVTPHANFPRHIFVTPDEYHERYGLLSHFTQNEVILNGKKE